MADKLTIYHYKDRSQVRVRRNDWPSDSFEILSRSRFYLLEDAVNKINDVLPNSIELVDGDAANDQGANS